MQMTSGASASGTLLVTQATHSASITLLGTYMTQNFNLLNDGAGGTVVTDPPVAVATDPNPLALVTPHQA
jgi:hypothetical protein